MGWNHQLDELWNQSPQMLIFLKVKDWYIPIHGGILGERFGQNHGVQLHKSPWSWWRQVSPSTLWIMELLSETFGKLLYNDLAESSRKDRSVIWGWKLEEFFNHFMSLWTWPSCWGYDKTPAGAQLEHHDNMIRFAGGIEWSKVQNLTKKPFSFLKRGFLLFIMYIYIYQLFSFPLSIRMFQARQVSI